MEMITWAHLTTLVSVILIDLTLAMDNAIIIGSIAANLDPQYRKKALFFGIASAAFFRVIFSFFALHLLSIVGVTFAGGLLLLWVSWKLWRELTSSRRESQNPSKRGTSLQTRSVIFQIILADISLSLDNTLAVTGAARNHFWILVFGLLLSMSLMGMAAHLVVKLMHRYRWIPYVGLIIVLYVALSMIIEGSHSLLP